MVLNLLANGIYEWVSQSWLVSTVLIKYLLVLHVGKMAYDREYSLKDLEDIVMDYSRLVVLIIVLLGAIVSLTGTAVEPRLKAFSQALALLYFGVLFWKF